MVMNLYSAFSIDYPFKDSDHDWNYRYWSIIRRIRALP